MTKRKFGKRTAVAGGVGLAVLLGWLLSMLPGFGTGGSGDGDSDSESEGVADTVLVEALDDSDVVSSIAGRNDSSTGNARVLDVILDSRAYLVRLDPENPEELTERSLEQIVALVKAASGNEDGIRVRIGRRENARVTTQKDLRSALAEAGITDDEILMLQEFVN